VGSTIARTCGAGVYLHAGAEVAVVSTKTLSASVLVFALIGLLLGRTRDLSQREGEQLIEGMRALPHALEGQLARAEEFRRLGRTIASYEHAFFIGRGAGFPLAEEGALKLKELSYVHAEAYPASELKHGPLALISEAVPTVVLVPNDAHVQRNLASIEEIRARGGRVLALTQVSDLPLPDEDQIRIGPSHPLLAPLHLVVPLQYLALEAALARGHDVDRPRNLAKSVTVA
jgi:glucosamine--fructose-6-phosphate aminotransferase (isomerizing)